jgi:phosphonate transport system permease protein
MTDATMMVPVDCARPVLVSFVRRRMMSVAVPLAILAYLLYAAVSFDLVGLAQRARKDNAAILLSDFWQHKTHVTRNNRTGELTVAVEGESKGLYPQGPLPDFVTVKGDTTIIDLGKGHSVVDDASGARYIHPDEGTIDIRPDGNRLILSAPEPRPTWIDASDTRVSITTEAGRFAYTRGKVETFRYSPGWPLFFFTLDSSFAHMSWLELGTAALWGERVNPDMPNIAAMVHDFWTNSMWRHGDVSGQCPKPC